MTYPSGRSVDRSRAETADATAAGEPEVAATDGVIGGWDVGGWEVGGVVGDSLTVAITLGGPARPEEDAVEHPVVSPVVTPNTTSATEVAARVREREDDAC